jgi:hypothetical protein
VQRYDIVCELGKSAVMVLCYMPLTFLEKFCLIITMLKTKPKHTKSMMNSSFETSAVESMFI